MNQGFSNEAPRPFEGFQKAVSFENPVQVIEIQPANNLANLNVGVGSST